jgi:hypothetical protein
MKRNAIKKICTKVTKNVLANCSATSIQQKFELGLKKSYKHVHIGT